MQDWSVPLVVAVAAFLVMLLWRVRPVINLSGAGGGREAMKAAMARVASAADGPTRAIALCDAADVSVTRARGLYLQALRADPRSADVVRRAAERLSRRPQALESLLWRHLGSVPWADARDAVRASLEALRGLYEGPLRNAVKAKAMGHARDLLN